jgi:hypothetical protein
MTLRHYRETIFKTDRYPVMSRGECAGELRLLRAFAADASANRLERT